MGHLEKPPVQECLLQAAVTGFTCLRFERVLRLPVAQNTKCEWGRKTRFTVRNYINIRVSPSGLLVALLVNLQHPFPSPVGSVFL